MAAVAGAVAEEVLEAIAGIPGLLAAHVNNGGDIALFLAPGQASLRSALVPSLERAAPEALVRLPRPKTRCAASPPPAGRAAASPSASPMR